MTDRLLRQTLIKEFYPIICKISKQMVRRFPSSVEADDLVSIGTIAFIEAIDRHQPASMSEFSVYAKLRVRGAIVDAMRAGDWVPRSVRQRHRDLVKTKEKLQDRFGREATIEEIAAEMEVSVERVQVIHRDAQIYSLVSIEETLPGSTQSLSHKISSDAPNQEDAAEKKSIAAVVRIAVNSLEPRDRSLIQLYYFEEMSFADIAGLLGLTESRISQMHTKIKKTLSKRIELIL